MATPETAPKKARIILRGLEPYDGEYEAIDVNNLTAREYHFIRELSGVRPMELEDALRNGDAAVSVAAMAVLLQRNGHPDVDLEVLWGHTQENFEVIPAAGGGDQDRPLDSKDPSGTPGGESNAHDESGSENETGERSGMTGNGAGDREENPPSPIGRLGSEESAT